MAHQHDSPSGIEPLLSETLDIEAESSDSGDAPVFCSFTFGQFFTMLVLLVVTVCGVFYLGARYGNRYLRLDNASTAAASTDDDLNSDPIRELPNGRPSSDDSLRQARAALQLQQQQKLESQVQQYLQNPASAPLGAAPPQALPPARLPQQVPPAQPMGYAPQAVAPAQGSIGTTSVVGPEDDPAAIVTGSADGTDLPYVAESNRGAALAQARGQVQATDPNLVHAAGPNEHVVGINAAQPAVQFQGAAGLPYAVQVAAYRDIREAQAKTNEWQSKGYPAYVTEVQLGDKGKWYRVRVGAFATKQEAANYLTELQQKETIEAMIVGQ